MKSLLVICLLTFASFAHATMSLTDMQDDCYAHFTQEWSSYPVQMPYDCFNISGAPAYRATMFLLKWVHGGRLTADTFAAVTQITTVGQDNCVEHLLPHYSSLTAEFLKGACSL